MPFQADFKEIMEQTKIKNEPAGTNKWYAVYTKPRTEKKVFSRLGEAGVEVFLPLMKTLMQWSDRKKFVEKPLLSSYVFVRTRPKFFPVVYHTTGVVRLVTFEGRPVAIPQYQIDNLRLLINSDAEIKISTEKYEKGDMVEITSGSLKGLRGELVRTGSGKRLVIRIDRIEKNIIVSVPGAFLKKLKKKV
ncbi:MAG: UpxY family transcription antiterminator [Bacteroidales bacterium]